MSKPIGTFQSRNCAGRNRWVLVRTVGCFLASASALGLQACGGGPSHAVDAAVPVPDGVGAVKDNASSPMEDTPASSSDLPQEGHDTALASSADTYLLAPDRSGTTDIVVAMEAAAPEVASQDDARADAAGAEAASNYDVPIDGTPVGPDVAVGNEAGRAIDTGGVDAGGGRRSSHPTGDLTTKRALHTATLLSSGQVLLAGGWDGTTLNSKLASAELYEPANGTFTATGPLNTARSEHTATVLNDGRVLIVGGEDSGGSYLQYCELYLPDKGIFVPAGSMQVPRYMHTATLLNNGKVLVAGGFNGYTYSSDAELYDPTTNSFALAGSMVIGRFKASATLLGDGTVLVAGGGINSLYLLMSAEIYDPKTGTFTSTGSMPTPEITAGAALLLNGKVLTVGGILFADAKEVSLSSAQLYDPVAGIFTNTGSLGIGRASTTTTLLQDGTVLLAGGRNGASTLASVEVYYPDAGNFVSDGTLSVPRDEHTATLLPNNRVLVAGGWNAASKGLSTAELYY
jgi:hypothetical protein